MEADPAVLSSSQDTWTALLDAAGLPAFTTSASPQLAGMLFELACIPTGHILPPNKLLKFPMPASSEGLLPNGSESGAEKHVLGGEEASDVARMRLAAGQALGQLACKFAVSGMAVSRMHLLCMPVLRALLSSQQPETACFLIFSQTFYLACVGLHQCVKQQEV